MPDIAHPITTTSLNDTAQQLHVPRVHLFTSTALVAQLPDRQLMTGPPPPGVRHDDRPAIKHRDHRQTPKRRAAAPSTSTVT